MTMRSISILILPLAAAMLAACAPTQHATDASEANFTQAMQAYLGKRGDLCVNRSTWPVVVTREEAQQQSRNSVQLPVLERLGLVKSSEVKVAATEAAPAGVGRSYDLTDEGRKYYKAQEPYKRDTGHAVADHEFCVARLSLKRVVGWEPLHAQGVGAETVVSYTYDIVPAPWTADPQVRAVFPMVDRVIRGAGTMELKEGMVLTAQGWEAREL